VPEELFKNNVHPQMAHMVFIELRWANAWSSVQFISHAPVSFITLPYLGLAAMSVTPISKYDLTTWFRHQRYQFP